MVKRIEMMKLIDKNKLKIVTIIIISHIPFLNKIT